MEILNKNLSCLRKLNTKLCDQISSLSQITKTFDINTNLAGEYNLLIDGNPVHSIVNINTEIDDLLRSLPNNSPTTIHFIYGLGLGYVADRYLGEANGLVVVFEPDIETLYYVFSVVDFTENFKKNKLYIISDIADLKELLDSIYNYKTSVTLSVLDYYKLHYKDKVNDFKQYLRHQVEMVNHNITFVTKSNYSFFTKTILDLHKKYDHYLMSDYKDAFKDVPALILSAGPSLAKNIETIKKYQNNALLFCGGSSLNTLYKNGITPDFLNVIERNNTLVHYDLPCTKDINFITEPYTHPCYFKKDFKRIFYTASLESDDARWFLENSGKPLIPYETKGTVAYHAIYTAYYLGCNPIILVGQDLAYSGGDCYAKGSAFDGLTCVFDEIESKYKVVFKDKAKFTQAYFKASGHLTEERKEEILTARINELNNTLRTVTGQNGEKLPTDAVYDLFLNYIQDFASEHKSERVLINSSIGGALIRGFDTVALEDAFAKYANKVLDKEKILDSVAYKNTFNKKKVYKNLKNDFEVVNKLLPLLNKALNLSNKFDEQLAKSDDLSSTIVDIHKNLISLFLEISNKYFFANRVCRIILFRLYMELDFLIRDTKGFELTLSFVKEFNDMSLDYYKDAILRAEYIFNKLNVNLKELEKENEGSLTKSKTSSC